MKKDEVTVSNSDIFDKMIDDFVTSKCNCVVSRLIKVNHKDQAAIIVVPPAIGESLVRAMFRKGKDNKPKIVMPGEKQCLN